MEGGQSVYEPMLTLSNYYPICYTILLFHPCTGSLFFTKNVFKTKYQTDAWNLKYSKDERLSFRFKDWIKINSKKSLKWFCQDDKIIILEILISGRKLTRVSNNTCWWKKPIWMIDWVAFITHCNYFVFLSRAVAVPRLWCIWIEYFL